MRRSNAARAAAVYANPTSLVPWEQNPRNNDDAVAGVMASIREYGFGAPIVARAENRMIIGGHTRWKAAIELGLTDVPVRFLDISEEKAKALALADNRLGETADWNEDALRDVLIDLQSTDLDLSVLGWNEWELTHLLEPAGESEDVGPTPTLFDRFGFPPFSVLDSRKGIWQERKRAWISIGIRSEIGRGDGLAFNTKPMNTSAEKKSYREQSSKKSAGVLWKSIAVADPGFYVKKRGVDAKLGRELSMEEFLKDHYKASDAGAASGTSVFDPVLCEMSYRWFAPPGGTVLDPFAGGSVRGVVAGRLGFPYVGIDLSAAQVAENRKQWAEISAARPSDGVVEPTWLVGDSRDLPKLAKKVDADLIFSCPPYADLERYSDDPKDLSTLDYGEFRAAYFDIVAKAVARLRDDRFAVFVVGEVRDKKGIFRGFVPDTIEAFKQAGAGFYNEAILVSPLGSVPVRAPRAFESGRKLGKTHQNVLIFVKGDPKKATEACGTVDVEDFAEAIRDWDGVGLADA